MSDFTVLVVQPDSEGQPDRFGLWLEEVGAELSCVRPFQGDRVPEVVEADGLLVLGGDMGAGDDADHPWLADVRALMRNAVAAEVPTLGICLGGQLLAAATGGAVARGAAGMEAGVVEVVPRAAAEHDELMARLPWPLLQGSMHRDAITSLPRNAVWLAASSAYRHQAFRVGRRAWGVQFHPELSPARYRRWAEYIRADELTTQRIVEGIDQFESLDDQVRTGAQALAHRFGELVNQHAGEQPAGRT
jgi:GMP synthase (glutamine-hydrolysing)